jgi:hypothetical protein
MATSKLEEHDSIKTDSRDIDFEDYIIIDLRGGDFMIIS